MSFKFFLQVLPIFLSVNLVVLSIHHFFCFFYILELDRETEGFTHDSRASMIALSDSASSALVASSRSIIAGLFSRALAMAIRCFCPPESWHPFSPTSVSYPLGKWHGITAQATRPILQLTLILTVVAITIEEMHCTITDIRSAIIVLTVDVSLVTLCLLIGILYIPEYKARLRNLVSLSWLIFCIVNKLRIVMQNSHKDYLVFQLEMWLKPCTTHTEQPDQAESITNVVTICIKGFSQEKVAYRLSKAMGNGTQGTKTHQNPI
ncbi:hypothetical protein ACJIZ3_022581 [Penstemon smallii]|uniref:Uncharacterized protein n=1 Tax=Penstemon smallii TaxID=265156 RepID=A0ABD3TMM1_9LAMI